MFSRLMAAFLLISTVSAGAGELQLVMFEEEGCVWCARWNSEIAPIYPKTPEGRAAPLQRIDLAQGSRTQFKLRSRPVYTPTFVIVDDGQEVGRIEGYPGEDFFWGLLGKILEPLPEFKATKGVL